MSQNAGSLSRAERKEHFLTWGRWLLGFALVPIVFGIGAIGFDYPTPNGPNGLCYVYLSSLCSYTGTVSAGSLFSYMPYFVVIFIGIVMIVSGVACLIRSGSSVFGRVKTSKQDASA